MLAKEKILNLQNGPLNYNRAEENASKINYRFVDFNLKHVKEHFSKLKFNYLELETKLHFMKKFQTDSGFIESLQPNDVKEMENALLQTKSNLKAIKAMETSFTDEIMELSNEIHKLIKTVNDSCEGIFRDHDLIEKMKLEMNNLSKESLPENKMTLEEAQNIVNSQMHALQSLISKIEASKCQSEAKKREIILLEEEIKRLEMDKLDWEAKAAKVTQQKLVRDRQIDDVYLWYKNTIQFLETLSFCTLTDFNDDVLSVVIRDIPVQIFLNNGKLTGVKMNSLEISDLHIQDLVDQALKSNDLCFMIREISARIESIRIRQVEIANLSKNYNVEIDDNLVCIKDPRSSNEWIFEVEEDYPRFSEAFTLIEGSDEDCEKLKQEKPKTITLAMKLLSK